MNIKFNEVTWYSKLAAMILFIGVIPALTFCIGKQYGEVMILSDQPIYISSDPQKIVITTEPATSTQDARFFRVSTSVNNGAEYSNIVGYFAGGNFFFYVPQWIPDNWKMTNLSGGGLKFSPMDNSGDNTDVNFSDIVISVSTSTERNNANTLYSNETSSENKALCISGSRCEVRDQNSSIVSSEVILSTVSDTRIYHIAKKQTDGTIKDWFYIDGKNLTAMITFSAKEDNYNTYENKIREFVQGIGAGEAPRG